MEIRCEACGKETKHVYKGADFPPVLSDGPVFRCVECATLRQVGLGTLVDNGIVWFIFESVWAYGTMKAGYYWTDKHAEEANGPFESWEEAGQDFIENRVDLPSGR